MARLAASRRRAPSASERRDQEVFDEIQAALEAGGWVVHVSRSLDGRGGDCIVRGQHRVILSHRLPVGERLDLLADAAVLAGVAPEGGWSAGARRLLEAAEKRGGSGGA